jgi:hypothetical protein
MWPLVILILVVAYLISQSGKKEGFGLPGWVELGKNATVGYVEYEPQVGKHYGSPIGHTTGSAETGWNYRAPTYPQAKYCLDEHMNQRRFMTDDELAQEVYMLDPSASNISRKTNSKDLTDHSRLIRRLNHKETCEQGHDCQCARYQKRESKESTGGCY